MRAWKNGHKKETFEVMNLCNVRPQCITEYVRVGYNLAVQLQIHPITSQTTKDTGVTEYWFCDRHLQEVLQLIKKPLFNRIHQRVEDENHKTQKDPIILTGNTVQLVYTFKKNPTKQYFLIMNIDSNSKDRFNNHLQNFCLKNEKVVVFVCRKEKGFSNLLKTAVSVSDSANKTVGTLSTISISNYFSSCDKSKELSSTEQQASTSAHFSNVKPTSTRKEKLKNIVSREKRLRTRKRNPQRSVVKNKLVENPKEDPLKSPKKSDDYNNTNEVATTKDQNSKTQSSPKSSKITELVSENSPNDDNLNKNTNKAHYVKEKELDSDGSTSSCENLPYYGISKSSNSEDPCISSSFEQDFDISSLYSSPVKNPSKLSSIGNISTSMDISLTLSDVSKNETCSKESCEKTKLQGFKDSYSILCSEGNSEIDSVNINVVNLTYNQILLLVKENKEYLRNIFQGKGISWRHKMYKNGGTDRLQLNYLCFWGCLSTSQLDSIMEGLFKMFCKRHMKYADYVSKVLLAEMITKLYMDTCHLTQEEAERLLQK